MTHQYDGSLELVDHRPEIGGVARDPTKRHRRRDYRALVAVEALEHGTPAGTAPETTMTKNTRRRLGSLRGHCPDTILRTTLPGPCLPDSAAPPSSSGKRPPLAATSAMAEAARASARGKVAAMAGTS